MKSLNMWLIKMYYIEAFSLAQSRGRLDNLFLLIPWGYRCYLLF